MKWWRTYCLQLLYSIAWPWVLWKASKAEFAYHSRTKTKSMIVANFVLWIFLLPFLVFKYRTPIQQFNTWIQGWWFVAYLFLVSIPVFISFFLINGLFTYFKHRKGIINPVLDAHQQALATLKERQRLGEILPKALKHHSNKARL